MKRKGFTLIELLAVIVILAIIALIALPVILGVVEKARLGSAESSALGYIDAVEKQISINLLDKELDDIVEGTYTIEELTNLGVKVKGTTPSSGEIIITNKVEIATLCIGNYKVEYKNNKATATKDSSCTNNEEELPPTEPGEEFPPTDITYDNGTPIYFNPVTGEKCIASEAISTPGTKVGCMKWYIYKDNGDTTYQLILDHNTTAVVAWNSSGNNTGGMKEVATALTKDTSSWDSSLNPRLITADEIAELVGANRDDTIKWNSLKPYGTNVNTQSSYFYLDGRRNSNPTLYASGSNGWQKQYAKSKGKSNYAWLLDYTRSCSDYGGNINHTSTDGYWTSTAVSGSTTKAWYISRQAYLYSYPVNDKTYLGVRPVITISKSNF